MIIGVIVTYQPEAQVFNELLNRLAPQVDNICIVDNSPPENNTAFSVALSVEINLDRLFFLRLGDNYGIATALNQGIEIAISEGADFVLLSDQDSFPTANMVSGLVAAFNALQDQGIRVGAVGPVFTDLHTSLSYPFQSSLPKHLFYVHRRPAQNKPHIEALTLITSGTLIPVEVFEKIGFMREDFFIDQVDIEWCHRARAHDYFLFGTGWAKMYQRMGDDNLRVWYLRWRNESAYSPTRLYYRLRNFVALCKLSFIDWRWKLRSSWYLLGVVYSHIIFGSQRFECLGMCVKGVWHGIIGRMGRYSN